MPEGPPDTRKGEALGPPLPEIRAVLSKSPLRVTGPISGTEGPSGSRRRVLGGPEGTLLLPPSRAPGTFRSRDTATSCPALTGRISESKPSWGSILRAWGEHRRAPPTPGVWSPNSDRFQRYTRLKFQL